MFHSIDIYSRTMVKESLYLLDMAGCTADTIDALNIEAEKIDSLHALINDHGNGCLISVVKVVQVTQDEAGKRSSAELPYCLESRVSKVRYCFVWRRRSHEVRRSW
jgi:hypothetical protein